MNGQNVSESIHRVDNDHTIHGYSQKHSVHSHCRAKPLDDIIKKSQALHDKWWSLIRIPVKSVWSASLPLTPYRGVLNRLSIAHCKALGESCLLSHKSSSWGVVGRSYGRQKKMANGTMKMVKASLNRLVIEYMWLVSWM